jgi:hypothetical protein
MSTKFGIPKREVDIQLGDESGIFDYISEDFFEPAAFRDNSGKLHWYKSFYESLPNDLRVYALDNSQQGIYTIGDIKNEMKEL